MRTNFRKLSIIVPVIALVVLSGLSTNVLAGPLSPIAAGTSSAKAATPVPPTPSPKPAVVTTANCPAGITAAAAAATPAATKAATKAATAAATKAATAAPTAAATKAAATPAATTAATVAATKAATKAATTAATPAATKAAAQSVFASKGCLLLTSLSGDTEVPDGGDPDGKGTAVIAIDTAKSELCYQINAENITLPAAAAHIHKGAEGVAGDVVVAFKAPDADGVATDCIEKVDATLLKDILAHPDNYYVNIHTSKYPKGALRGQLAAATLLSGANEVTKVDAKGVGAASIWADVATGELCYDLYVEGITLPAAAAHIHKGAAGVDGDVVIPFKGAPGAKGRLNACVEGIDAAILKDLIANPANYYVNVHTSDAPKGAIRGQLGAKK